MVTEPNKRHTPKSGREPFFTGLALGSGLILAGLLFGSALWLLVGVVVALLLAVNQSLAKIWSTHVIAVRLGGSGGGESDTAADVEVGVGSRVPVRLEITNHAKIPVGWILVEDLLPRWALRAAGGDARAAGTDAGRHVPQRGVEVDGDRLAVMTLRPGQTRTIEYTIHCRRRGYFQVGPTVLETGDFLGLFRRYRVATRPQYITVLPKVRLLSGYDIASRRPIGEIRMRDNVMDDPTRLRGIRRWQPGDPMRSVHWAATARTGTLHSKIYEPSSIAGATIVLDFHRASNPARHEPVRGDLAVTAAASIAAAVHQQGEPFGLLSNGRDAADRIRRDGWTGDHRVRDTARAAAGMLSRNDRLRPVVVKPDRGPTHFHEVLRRLARLEPTDGLTLAQLLVESESQISNATTVLIVLQTCDEATASAIIGMSRRGWEVAVIINTHDINDYSRIAAPLIATRIPTFRLTDEPSITDVCRAATTRS